MKTRSLSGPAGLRKHTHSGVVRARRQPQGVSHPSAISSFVNKSSSLLCFRDFIGHSLKTLGHHVRIHVLPKDRTSVWMKVPATASMAVLAFDGTDNLLNVIQFSLSTAQFTIPHPLYPFSLVIASVRVPSYRPRRFCLLHGLHGDFRNLFCSGFHHSYLRTSSP